MDALQNIKNTMESLMGPSETLIPELSAILERCRQTGSIGFEQVADIAGADAGELLLLAWDWKLLIPRRSGQCAEWDDRMLQLQPGELYDMVNVVRWLLSSVADTGAWNPSHVIRNLYDFMGEPESGKLPNLVAKIIRQARHRRISGAGIHVACVHTGLGDRTGAMIAILKGGGVISPSLMSGNPAAKTGSPLYDVHPVLCNICSEDCHAT